MGAERIKLERKVKDCGNSWCDYYVGCKGHTIGYTYNSVVDIITITIDGEVAISGGENLIEAVAGIIEEANHVYDE